MQANRTSASQSSKVTLTTQMSEESLLFLGAETRPMSARTRDNPKHCTTCNWDQSNNVTGRFFLQKEKHSNLLAPPGGACTRLPSRASPRCCSHGTLCAFRRIKKHRPAYDLMIATLIVILVSLRLCFSHLLQGLGLATGARLVKVDRSAFPHTCSTTFPTAIDVLRELGGEMRADWLTLADERGPHAVCACLLGLWRSD